MKRKAYSKLIWIALIVTTACTAGLKYAKPDDLGGQWSGYIDRDGWERELSLNIANENGAYGGTWMSRESQPGVMLDSVAVDGDTVRFQLNNLTFAGHITGGTLTGEVTDSASGAPSGQFTLMRIEPHPEIIP